jgi:hypothetical protein
MMIWSTVSTGGFPLFVRGVIHANCCVYALPIIVAFIRPEWWAACSAAGALVVAFTNGLALWAAKVGSRKFARLFRGGRPEKLMEDGLEFFSTWWLGMFVYGVVLAGVFLLTTGYAWMSTHYVPIAQIRDKGLLAVSIGVVNFWLLVAYCFVWSGKVRSLMGSAAWRLRVLRAVKTTRAGA